MRSELDATVAEGEDLEARKRSSLRRNAEHNKKITVLQLLTKGFSMLTRQLICYGFFVQVIFVLGMSLL